jgi:gamma-glutamyltranspeptidase
MLKEYNLNPTIINSTSDYALFYHRLTETFKHAFAKRSYFGDSNFVEMKEVSNKEKVLGRYLLIGLLFIAN